MRGFWPVPEPEGTFWRRGLRTAALVLAWSPGWEGGLPAPSLLRRHLSVTLLRVSGVHRAPRPFPRAHRVQSFYCLISSLTSQRRGWGWGREIQQSHEHSFCHCGHYRVMAVETPDLTVFEGLGFPRNGENRYTFLPLHLGQQKQGKAFLPTVPGCVTAGTVPSPG